MFIQLTEKYQNKIVILNVNNITSISFSDDNFTEIKCLDDKYFEVKEDFYDVKNGIEELTTTKIYIVNSDLKRKNVEKIEELF